MRTSIGSWLTIAGAWRARRRVSAGAMTTPPTWAATMIATWLCEIAEDPEVAFLLGPGQRRIHCRGGATETGAGSAGETMMAEILVRDLGRGDGEALDIGGGFDVWSRRSRLNS